MKRLVSAALALVIFVAVGLWFAVNLEYESKPEVLNFLGFNPVKKWQGEQAPDFTLRELKTGKKVELRSLRGKAVLLEFWATWCPPCLKQLPILQKLSQDPAFSKKISIYTINMKEMVDNVPEHVSRFAKRHGFTMPILLGTKEVVKRYKIWFFPTMVLISADGKVLYTGAEFHTEKKVRALLKRL